MPVQAQGLDWTPFVPKSDFAAPDPAARWVAFGSGEERVYLDTPRWRDIRPATIWSALTGGKRVMHVEWVSNPHYLDRAVRLRPEEYRRLWAAIRADFELDERGRPRRIDHPGYGRSDAFYWATGKFHALKTCNTWAASRCGLAGVKNQPLAALRPGLGLALPQGQRRLTSSGLRLRLRLRFGLRLRLGFGLGLGLRLRVEVGLRHADDEALVVLAEAGDRDLCASLASVDDRPVRNRRNRSSRRARRSGRKPRCPS